MICDRYENDHDLKLWSTLLVIKCEQLANQLHDDTASCSLLQRQNIRNVHDSDRFFMWEKNVGDHDHCWLFFIHFPCLYHVALPKYTYKSYFTKVWKVNWLHTYETKCWWCIWSSEASCQKTSSLRNLKKKNALYYCFKVKLKKWNKNWSFSVSLCSCWLLKCNIYIPFN